MEDKKPVEITDEIIEKILVHVTMGRNLAEISVFDDMPTEEQMTMLVRNNPAFEADFYKSFKAHFSNRMLNVMTNLEKKGKEDSYADVFRAKCVADMTVKIATKLIPKYLGDSIDINLGGEVEMKRVIMYPNKLPEGAGIDE